MSTWLVSLTVLLAVTVSGQSPIIRRSATPPTPGAHLDADEAAVVKVDEEYRLAKLRNDTDTLQHLLADDFYEMNQNGNGRNKSQTITLWQTFPITSLTTDRGEIRVTVSTAVVTGQQTELNGGGTDRMLFMRTYIRRLGRWQLLASMQFRNPHGR
jgi:Domain of unknown function (DUF4440)